MCHRNWDPVREWNRGNGHKPSGLFIASSRCGAAQRRLWKRSHLLPEGQGGGGHHPVERVQQDAHRKEGTHRRHCVRKNTLCRESNGDSVVVKRLNLLFVDHQGWRGARRSEWSGQAVQHPRGLRRRGVTLRDKTEFWHRHTLITDHTCKTGEFM